MGSIFTTSKDAKIKSTFGKGKFIPFYLQFVPGVCVETITNKKHLKSYFNDKNTNSILAISHIRGGKPKKKKTSLNNNDRYFPLLRGVYEVPAKGDPVLLCTIGSKNYYLGPLNTDNNPNWNEDNLWEPEIPVSSKPGSHEKNPRLMKGESLNFSKVRYKRMSKSYNEILDGTNAYNETHGDIMLEGRHGNSIRVGSRGTTPYVYISNGRQSTFTQEGFADGTLISITNRGSLNQHFGGYAKQIESSGGDDMLELDIVDGFTLASDYVSLDEDAPVRFMGDLVRDVNGSGDVKEIIYDYGSDEEQNQILASSDRITINSKSDDIYLSSNKDIHIGTKRHLTISTNENLIIESEQTYLGNPTPNGQSVEMDHMVLGKKLQDVLKDIVALFGEIKVATLLGPQGTMPLPSEQSVITAIDDILSSKHFLDE